MSAFQALLHSTDFLIIGHRGAAGLEAENTLPSFQRALDLGCDAIELDVQCSKDNHDHSPLWVIHDDTVNRTTDKTGRVDQLTDAELATMLCSNGASIPTLGAVLDMVDEHNQKADVATVINVELKGRATAKPTARLLADYPQLTFLVSSFDHNELRHFRDLDSHTPVAPLFHKWHDQATTIAKELSACCINLAARLATPDRCAAIQAHNLEVLAYTVNSKSTAKRLQNMGVKGIFTDRPDLFRETEHPAAD